VDGWGCGAVKIGSRRRLALLVICPWLRFRCGGCGLEMWLAIFNRGLLIPYESYKAISYHAHLRSVTSRLLPVFAGSCKCKARLLYEPVLRRAVESLWLRQLHAHGEGFLIDEESSDKW